MSVCVEAERGECLATDNPKNTFIHSDFHTINHGIIPDRRQSSIHRNTWQWVKPDAHIRTSWQAGGQGSDYWGLSDSSMHLIYVTLQMEGISAVCWHSMAACGAPRATGTTSQAWHTHSVSKEINPQWVYCVSHSVCVCFSFWGKECWWVTTYVSLHVCLFLFMSAGIFSRLFVPVIKIHSTASSGFVVCACWIYMCRVCALCQPGPRRWHSNQVLLHMFPVSAPRFPQRAGQLIASLVIGGLGRGHDYHLAHSAANMAGFLFHLPLKLNHFCAKIDCCVICI